MASKDGAIDLFHHAKDSTAFEFFETINWKLELLAPESVPSALQWLLPYGFTKFMLLELIVAILIVLLVVPVARRLRNGELPKGRWANSVEAILLFIRDEVARPAIPDHAPHHDTHGVHHDTPHEPGEGHHIEVDEKVHRADHYLPLLWTMFLFILGCNLIGMIPFSGSPTGSIAVTGVLSLITFFVIHIAGIKLNGVGPYFKSFIPKVEGLPWIMAVTIAGGVFAIEFMSLFIRNIVLAVRLFANMVGGHTALFLMLLFIQMIGTSTHEAAGYLFWPVTIGSTLLVLAMSLLELFVALLQAYVFTMLTATFIGLAVAPEH